ncbi:hypothetical protein NE237_014535 [Protea cynaroides]|uniref:SNF2 N-terminal domain-containing protein n=1 Tax=Protea cynaroides TaxID=273540 RepID=A0A9Q0KCC4_9MAGN|nr:hypothetical protein NE237_014535 [Protea cynaroides]
MTPPKTIYAPSFFDSRRNQRQPNTSICKYALVFALESCFSLLAMFQGEHLHVHLLKSSLDSNIFVYNSLINLLCEALVDRHGALFDLILVGIDRSIGASISVVTGTVGRDAEPGVAISLSPGGASCVLNALCYAELASHFPAAVGKTLMAIALILANRGNGIPVDQMATKYCADDTEKLSSMKIPRQKAKTVLEGGTLIVCYMSLLSQWKEDEVEAHSKPDSISVVAHCGGDW